MKKDSSKRFSPWIIFTSLQGGSRKKGRVYITDFFADSMLFYRDSKKEYESLLVLQTDAKYYRCYVNGIIETGYQERLSEFRKEMECKKSVIILLEERYSDIYNYLFYELNCFYSFQPDFFTAFEENLGLNPSSFAITELDFLDDSLIKDKKDLVTRRLTYDESLSDGKAFARKGKLMSVLEFKNESELLDYVKNGNENGGISLSFLTRQKSNDEEENRKNSNRYRFTLELLDDKTPDDRILFYFSKNVYRKIRSDNSFVYHYQGRYTSKLEKALSRLSTEKITLYCVEAEFVARAYAFLNAFSSISEFLALVLFALWILLSIFYVYSLAKSQDYALSVYKACGLKRAESI